MPAAKPVLLSEEGKSHYYPARETDASPIRVCSRYGTEWEKFLFYRGVADFSVPISSKLDANQIHIKNLGKEEISPIILFEKKGDKVGYRIHSTLKDTLTIERPELRQDLPSLLQELESILISQGLYEKEAKAMIATWRDTWFKDGLRVFYIFPTSLTDKVLPLTITPKPQEVVRILVGYMEIVTPEMKGDIYQLITQSDNIEEIAKLLTDRYGRFAGPVMKNILMEVTNHEIKGKIDSLLAQVGE